MNQKSVILVLNIMIILNSIKIGKLNQAELKQLQYKIYATINWDKCNLKYVRAK